MNECKIGEIISNDSLETFVRRIKGNKYRLEDLQEKLEWVIHLFFSIPGPNYDRVGTPSNVQPDRIVELLDREDKLRRKIQRIYDEEELLHKFEAKLTEKELKVFHLYYFKSYSQSRVAVTIGITQQCVCQYLKKLEKKWAMFKK